MGTWVPEVNSCCYFISLRTGAKLCGFIALVGCLFLAILSAVELIFAVKHSNDHHNFKILSWQLGIEIALQLIHMAASCCMLLGIYQEQASFLTPWLFTAILMAVMEVIFMDPLVARLYGVKNFHPLTLEWILLSVFMLVDDIYGWLVVFSYYRSIKTREQNQFAERIV